MWLPEEVSTSIQNALCIWYGKKFFYD